MSESGEEGGGKKEEKEVGNLTGRIAQLTKHSFFSR